MNLSNDSSNRMSFSFADFDTSEDEIDEEEHEQELFRLAQEAKEKVKGWPNSVFPDFLWDPMINEFDDFISYVECGLKQPDPAIQAAQSLKRKYNDYFEYIDALEVWQEYADAIADEFGSFESYSESVNEGLINGLVKPRPRLKNKKENKSLIRLPVALSRDDKVKPVGRDVMMKILEDIEDQVDVYEDDLEYTTKLYKVNQKEEKRMREEYRIRNARRLSVSANTDPSFDAVIQFIQNGSSDDTRNGIRNKSMSAEIEAMHEYDYLPEGFQDDELAALNRSVRIDGEYGCFVTNESKSDFVVYTTLSDNGFEVMNALKNSKMDKAPRKAILNRIQQTSGEYSDKKLKKMKKKRRRAEKELSNRMMENEQMRKILLGNKVQFKREDEMMSFTINDILRGDDD